MAFWRITLLGNENVMTDCLGMLGIYCDMGQYSRPFGNERKGQGKAYGCLLALCTIKGFGVFDWGFLCT